MMLAPDGLAKVRARAKVGCQLQPAWLFHRWHKAGESAGPPLTRFADRVERPCPPARCRFLLTKLADVPILNAPEVLKTDGNWQDAMKQNLTKKKPAKGWPK